MPQISTPVTIRANTSITLQDAAGRTARVSVQDLTASPTAAQVTALSNAIGDVSNAAVITETTSVQTFDNVAAREVFDEAYSGVTTKAVLIFQNGARDTKKLEIPAPDASIFGSDGNTVNPQNADVQALVTAYQAVVGAGYALVRGSLSSRSRKAISANIPPPIAEPGVGDAPSQLPALP